MRRSYDALDAAGLAPLMDYELEIVRAECPACQAGAADPQGIYRPLSVACHGRDPITWCSAGCSDLSVAEALRTEPIDWRTIALEAQDIATDALMLASEAAHRATRPQRRLQVAA